MFKDRFEAGKELVERLIKYKNSKDAIILAIPRGGLQIGHVLATELNIPLDIIIVKKIPHPSNPEYAIGAVGIEEVILNKEVVVASSIPDSYVDAEVKELTEAIKQRYKNYRGNKPLPKLKGKTVILADDGLATGHTMMAAVGIVKKQNPKKVVLAVPVAPPETIKRFKGVVDEIVCLDQPSFFFAIGEFYANFEQVEDGEAIRLLKEANE